MRLARAMKRKAEKSAAVGELRAVKDYARIKKTVRHATTREVVMCEKARKETETASMIIMDVAVNRVFGIGKKNALRLRKKMNSHMECIKRKYVTVAEIEGIIRDELRMDLTKESNVSEWDMLSRVQYETVCEMTAVFCWRCTMSSASDRSEPRGYTGYSRKSAMISVRVRLRSMKCERSETTVASRGRDARRRETEEGAISWMKR